MLPACHALLALALGSGQTATPTSPFRAPEVADRTIDAGQREKVIGDVRQALREQYVFPEVATRMADDLGARLERKQYDEVTGSKEFARRLTEDLQAICRDKHVRVRYVGPPPPGEAGRPGPRAEMEKRMLESNCGFERLERLAGNIGYLDLRAFPPVELAGDLAEASMNFLARTEGLIIDLRQNGGGTPEMVQLLCSYFFGAEPVHLNDLYFRPMDETREFWTLADVPGKRYLDRPVFLLTSSRTFSGAEEFAYDLQNQKRVTIVGETTGGGANPGGSVRIAAGFEVFVPMGRAINPVTGTNWEGKGVEPDVKCDAVGALERAHELVLLKLIAGAQGERKQRLEEALAGLR